MPQPKTRHASCQDLDGQVVATEGWLAEIFCREPFDLSAAASQQILGKAFIGRFAAGQPAPGSGADRRTTGQRLDGDVRLVRPRAGAQMANLGRGRPAGTMEPTADDAATADAGARRKRGVVALIMNASTFPSRE
ncbi:MAG: hypothetical protein R6U98_23305 [Pirellulaceae bacterium]